MRPGAHELAHGNIRPDPIYKELDYKVTEVTSKPFSLQAKDCECECEREGRI